MDFIRIINFVNRKLNSVNSNGLNESQPRNGITYVNSLVNGKPFITNGQTLKKTSMKLSRIFIYPIKSCGAFEIQNSWKLTARGFLFDREWMIMTSNGVCLTQKQEPKMCLIVPSINLDKNELRLSYPGDKFSLVKH